MPIIGLTDRGASFPRVGELRKGGEKPQTGNKPGPDLKYFRFTSQHNDVTASFVAAYGNQPTAVNVYLPFQTATENFDAWIEEWGAGSLKWRGDGQRLVIWQKPDGTYSQEPKPQPQQGGKQVGRLKVIVPELGRLAYVVALTTSLHDIAEMSATLDAYEALRGDLRGIPFVLSRVPRMVSTPEVYPKGHPQQYQPTGKRKRMEKWLWHLEAQATWVQAQLSVMQRAALPTGGAIVDGQYQLSAGAVDVDTGEIYDDDDEQGQPVIVEQAQHVQSETAVNDAPMTDDELVVSETPATKFFDAVTALINRYENVHATKAEAKKLGFTAVPGIPAARVDMYRAIKAHAAERDAEEADAKAEPLFDLEENGAYIE